MSDDNNDSEPRIIRPDQIPRSKRDIEQRIRSKSPTFDQVREIVYAGSMAAAQKMYTQLTDENSRLIADMEDIVVDRVLRRIEERSLRGRIKRFLTQVRKKPTIKLDPQTTFADETAPPDRTADPMPVQPAR